MKKQKRAIAWIMAFLMFAGTITVNPLRADAEEQQKTVIEAYPNSPMAEEYRVLAKQIRKLCGI